MYRITDWEKHFQNNRTREIKFMSWVPIPTKMDGDGFTELLDHPNGAAHYGAWITCVHVAAKSHPRGSLVRADGRPHDIDSLSRITRIQRGVLSEALPRLLSIGWLEEVTLVSDTSSTQLLSSKEDTPDCGDTASMAHKGLWRG